MAFKVNGTIIVDNNGDITGAAKKGMIPTVREGGKHLRTLINPNDYGTPQSDQFGYGPDQSIAISGNRCVVSAKFEDDTSSSTSASGVVYIFDVDSGNLLCTIQNPNPFGTTTSDYFGHSVAISGNRCIIGVPLEDDPVSSAGKAYIYDADSGQQVQQLDNPNTDPGSAADQFGYSVAISGNICAVSATAEDSGADTSSGVVYIFEVNSGQLLHTLINPNAYNTKANDQFGYRLAMSGSRLAACAPYEDSALGSTLGYVYIFDVSSGDLLYSIPNPNPNTTLSDAFGQYALGISGNRCIVGAYAEDLDGTNSGLTYVFTDGTLSYTFSNPNVFGSNSSDFFGATADISGDICVIGAPFEDFGVSSSGTVYVYDLSSATPTSPIHILQNPNIETSSGGDNFGRPVAVSGNRCLISAYVEDFGGVTSGTSYIFRCKESYDYYVENSPLRPLTALNNYKEES